MFEYNPTVKIRGGVIVIRQIVVGTQQLVREINIEPENAEEVALAIMMAKGKVDDAQRAL